MNAIIEWKKKIKDFWMWITSILHEFANAGGKTNPPDQACGTQTPPTHQSHARIYVRDQRSEIRELLCATILKGLGIRGTN